MTRKVHRDDSPELARARERLDAACVHVSSILDEGERDPRWSESQELEAAALELGRLLRASPPAPRPRRSRSRAAE